MSVYTYKQILEKAKSIKKNVEKEYRLGEYTSWGYYIAKAVINPNINIKQISMKAASKPSGTSISNQIYKKDYLDVAKRIAAYVEKHNQLPNYATWGNYKIRVRDYVYMLARVLVYYDANKSYPKYAELNTKVWVKPTEYPNKVYGLWVKYIKTTPKMLDDVCDYILKHFNYQFYYDDYKSNEEVLKSKGGNCTDLLQVLCNMAQAMDYDFEVIHTKCNKSGVGHVYGRFKKKGTSNWFIRDIACIADESRYCIWCQVGNGGTQLARNPSWFMQNLNR